MLPQSSGLHVDYIVMVSAVGVLAAADIAVLAEQIVNLAAPAQPGIRGRGQTSVDPAYTVRSQEFVTAAEASASDPSTSIHNRMPSGC